MPTTNGAAPFPPVSYAAWRAGVEAELGADGVSRRLRAMTEDGIAIEPLYAPGGPGDGEARNLAGRVMGLLREGAGGFRIRQRFPMDVSAEMVNAAIAGGVRSIELASDGTQIELDCLIPVFEGLDIPPSLFGDIELSFENVEFNGGIEWKAGPTSRGDDPVGRWLGGGANPGKLASEVARDTQRLPRTVARFIHYRASGDTFFDAGATSGMTLGATMAIALSYLRAIESGATNYLHMMEQLIAKHPENAEGWSARIKDGIRMEWAAAAIEVRLPCGPRFFESAAMLRAARLVWARILERSGIQPTPLQLVASTGRRALTRHDPWNNALRSTSVAFAAAIGGADVLQLLPHDIRNAESSAAALRLARTTGLILQEEAHLGRVLDPAEGSWFLESLTAELAEEAWGELRRLEAAGGIIAAIESGELSQRIAEAAAARHERVKARRHPIIGVTEHPVEGEVVVPSAEEIAEAAVSSPLPFRPDAQPFEGRPR